MSLYRLGYNRYYTNQEKVLEIEVSTKLFEKNDLKEILFISKQPSEILGVVPIKDLEKIDEIFEANPYIRDNKNDILYKDKCAFLKNIEIDDLIEKEKDREKEKENCKKEIKLLKEELEKLNSSQKLNLEKKTKANSFKVEADTNFKNVVLEIEKRTKKNFEFETEKIELLKREKVLLKEKEELQNFIKIEES